MQIATLVSVLDQPHVAAEHLPTWRLSQPEAGRQVLLELAESGLTLDLLVVVAQQLATQLPKVPNPDAALAAFGRYMLAVRSPLAFAALLERDPEAMPVLLTALSLGEEWAELLVEDPEAFDLLRESTGRSALNCEELASEVGAEVAAFEDEKAIVATLSRIRRRQFLRVAYGEMTGSLSAVDAQQQLSTVADALAGAALSAALEKSREGRALSPELEKQVRVCVLAVGAWGARQLSYALSGELLVIYDAPAPDATTLHLVQDRVERAARLLVRWLSEASGDPASDPIKPLSLPDSPLTAAAHTAEDAVVGYDSFGRTWHRQQLLKARPVAGVRELGVRVLSRLESWLFRRYLNRADETGIKALKRRILVTATLHQDDWRSPRLARGGLRDIESTLEWLQLLVGGDQPSARLPSTLTALAGLAEAGTLAPDEQAILADDYVFFTELEHRLQIAAGSPASLHDDPGVERQLAALSNDLPREQTFDSHLRQRQDRCWQIIRKLLVTAFAEEAPPAREVELLLDPAPPPHEVRAALAPFGFAEPEQALSSLNDLAAEQVPFLSTRRCRHLLANILPRLLAAIAATPRPDWTLSNLARVSNSLGGKGVLWDLFRSSPPTLELYVKLCAASPYLSGILTNNPGMIDELVDSLQLDRLPTRAELAATLQELTRGLVDPLPALHDFKNAEHLRIGVRDLLGKEDIDRTHEALADVAETCLTQLIDLEHARLVEKYGVPTIGLGPFEGELCRLIVLALGKLGGREPNYHSQLDLLLLYEAEGTTRPARPSRRLERTTNNHFFTQLAQRIAKLASELTPKGRLYAIETPLQPLGVAGALAMTLDEFARHFREGSAPLWHWQTICQARPVYGAEPARQAAAQQIEQLIHERTWQDTELDELRRTRLELQRGASTANLKRGPGGTLDVELLVQVLQLRHAGKLPGVLSPGTQSAIAALAASKALDSATANQLEHRYRFLRRVESGVRLLNTSARHDLPEGGNELAQLAYLLGHSNPDRLREQCHDAMAMIRAIFDRLTQPA